MRPRIAARALGALSILACVFVGPVVGAKGHELNGGVGNGASEVRPVAPFSEMPSSVVEDISVLDASPNIYRLLSL